MVFAIAVVFNHYLSVPYSNFTGKAISALGVLGLMDQKKESVKKDIIEIKNIIDTTSDELHFSMYVLDRWVNPEGVIDESLTLWVSDKSPAIMKNKYRNGRTFTKSSGGDYFLQKKLCEAIAKIHVIVMKNISSYNIDFEVGGELIGM